MCIFVCECLNFGFKSNCVDKIECDFDENNFFAIFIHFSLLCLIFVTQMSEENFSLTDFVCQMTEMKSTVHPKEILLFKNGHQLFNHILLQFTNEQFMKVTISSFDEADPSSTFCRRLLVFTFSRRCCQHIARKQPYFSNDHVASIQANPFPFR